MGSSQQFCLKWNNHHSNLLSVFDDLYKNESFCDVTLACDGSSVRAHKNVLSACSPFFHALFVQNPCKHPIVILKDIRFDDLKALVEFMYRGEVNVSQDELPALLKTAETLKIRGLAGGENGRASDQDGGDVRRRSKRKRRRKSGDAESAGEPSSDSEPEVSRTPVQKSSHLKDQQNSSSSAAVPSSAVSHPKDSVDIPPASTPPVIRTAKASQPSEVNADMDFEPTDILEATMATHVQSTPVQDTRQAGNATSEQSGANRGEEILIPDDSSLDIKPIITFEGSSGQNAVPTTSSGTTAALSGASNSSSMDQTTLDASGALTFSDAGLPSTSGAAGGALAPAGASGATPHGMYKRRAFA